MKTRRIQRWRRDVGCAASEDLRLEERKRGFVRERNTHERICPERRGDVKTEKKREREIFVPTKIILCILIKIGTI